MQQDSVDNNRSNKMVEQKSIAQLFCRYSNVLEVHLRYQQPVGVVMAPLVSRGLLITKYLFTHLWISALASLMCYLASILVLTYVTTGLVMFFPVIASSWAWGLFCGLGNLFALIMLTCFLTPPIQAGVLFANAYLRWQKEAGAALRGPTHIALSPLSIKLLWKGAMFSSIGAMFGWTEITSVDLDLPVDDPLAAPSVVIRAQEGKIIHNIFVRLDGFSSDEERLVFLNSIDDHVAEDRKTKMFRRYLADTHSINALLACVKQHTADGILAQKQESSSERLLIAGMAKEENVVSESTTVSTESAKQKDSITNPK
jgi:hypothetical protein